MYHAALPTHLILTHMMNNCNVSPHSVATFYTACPELAPLFGTTGLITTCAEFDQSLKSSSLWTESINYHSPVQANCRHENQSQVSGRITGVKGNKRQSEFGNNSRHTHFSKYTNMKRRTTNGHKDSDTSASGSSCQPPTKRPLLSACSSKSSSPRIDVNKEWDCLSREMWDKFMCTQQTEDVFMRKMRLRDAIYMILQEAYAYCGLYVVGSSMNGFGGNSSDMDMCLMLSHTEIDQKTEATSILRTILRSLKKLSYIQKLELIRAKVPILKFHDSFSGVEVDLNINNAVGIRNTHLLKCYSKADSRVRPLVLIVKMWARIQDINDAKCMTISSYSLVLMVIHYLQSGVSPPILPCLQKLYPYKFTPNSDVRTLVIDEELPRYHSQNRMCLGELLLGFLDYYANTFDFDTEAISIRCGSKLPKHYVQNQQARKNNPGQWKCLSIEEPFDLTNTARSVYDDDVFARVKRVFHSSWRRLLETKELGAILVHQ